MWPFKYFGDAKEKGRVEGGHGVIESNRHKRTKQGTLNGDQQGHP